MSVPAAEASTAEKCEPTSPALRRFKEPTVAVSRPPRRRFLSVFLFFVRSTLSQESVDPRGQSPSSSWLASAASAGVSK